MGRPKGHAPYNRLQDPFIKTTSQTIRQFVEVVNQSTYSYRALCELAGYTPDSITAWKAGRATPNILTVETMLGVLGYELKVVKKEIA